MERARQVTNVLCVLLRLEDSRPESIRVMVEGKLGRRKSNEMAHRSREMGLPCATVTVAITLDVVSVVPSGSPIGPVHSLLPSLRWNVSQDRKDRIRTLDAICNPEAAPRST